MVRIAASSCLVLFALLSGCANPYQAGDWGLEHEDFPYAETAFSNAIRSHPEDWHCWNGRGTARSAQGKYAAAIEDFDKAIALNPRYSKAWGGRAIARSCALGFTSTPSEIAAADIDGAISDYNQVVSLNEHPLLVSEALKGLCILQTAKGDYAAALASADRVPSYEPGSQSTILKACVLATKGDEPGVRTQIESLRKVSAQDAAKLELELDRIRTARRR